MTRSLLIAAALTLGLAAPALAELAKGDVPKPVGSDASFVNCDEVDFTKWRGKVVVLQLGHTKVEQTEKQVLKLKELRTKYGEKGLVLVSVFEESLADVKAFVQMHAIDYPVVAGVTDLRTRWGRKGGFPTTYILDVQGKVAWVGNFADRADPEITMLLRHVSDVPWVPATYAEVLDNLDLKDYAAARAAIEKTLAAEDVPKDDRGRLEALRGWMDKQADASLATALKKKAKQTLLDRYHALEEVVREHAGSGAAAKAQAELDAMDGDKKVKRELDAWRMFVEQFAQAKKVELTDKKAAMKLLKKVITKYRGTKAAAKAEYWVDLLKG